MTPKISVIITTYNRAHYICETIDSVLAQTFTDYEIIVVDDGSTDNTKETLKAYGDKVRYFYQTNQGQPAAENTAISNARGQYLAFVDDDDSWLPTKLEEQIKVLENDPDLGFVCCEAYYTDADGKIVHHWKKKPWHHENFISLYDGNFLNHSSVLLKRDLFDKIGGFDPALLTTQDYDLWLRLAYVCKFKFMPVPLTKIRLHPNNKHKNKVRKLKDRVRIIQKASNMAGINFVRRQVRIAQEFYTHAEYFQLMGMFGLAGRTFIQSSLLCPWIGQYYSPGKNKILNLWPYRILRTYVRAVYCFAKALGGERLTQIQSTAEASK
jgi:glycosyltransferase involved in cell wall biosynthesis